MMSPLIRPPVPVCRSPHNLLLGFFIFFPFVLLAICRFLPCGTIADLGWFTKDVLPLSLLFLRFLDFLHFPYDRLRFYLSFLFYFFFSFCRKGPFVFLFGLWNDFSGSFATSSSLLTTQLPVFLELFFFVSRRPFGRLTSVQHGSHLLRPRTGRVPICAVHDFLEVTYLAGDAGLGQHSCFFAPSACPFAFEVSAPLDGLRRFPPL